MTQAERLALAEHPRPWKLQVVGVSAHVLDALGDTVIAIDQDDAIWPFIVQEVNRTLPRDAAPAVKLPMQADIAQIISRGQANVKTADEIAGEILDECDAAPAGQARPEFCATADAVCHHPACVCVNAADGVRDDAIPLADHDEIGRKVLGQPWAIQSAIITIAAHCKVLTDKCPTGDVADLAGCISQTLLELANATPHSPSAPPADVRAMEDARDIIVAYFDTHGINNARAGAFNILDRLKSAGLCVLPASGTAGGDYDFDNLSDLVTRFSTALLEKLKASEVKYGHNSGWMRDDWHAECQRHLNEHLAKGDPRDVAAYCAFLWHHGWATVGPLTPEDVSRVQAISLAQPEARGEAVAWRFFYGNTGSCGLTFEKETAERWAKEGKTVEALGVIARPSSQGGGAREGTK